MQTEAARAKTIEDLIRIVKEHDPQANTERIREAFAFADQAHEGQMRASGEPYVTHSLQTAAYLASMRLPENMIIAGLLHDVPEDTTYTIEDVQERFGEDIGSMVSGITKLGRLKYRGIERYIENLRKMFIAMAQDIRVIIIKFADRFHNLETLDALPSKKAYRIALETLQIFAPIANRLGMGEMKGRLEDASFQYVYPKEYEWTMNLSKTTREGKREYLQHVLGKTQDLLSQAGIQNVEVHGRAKHLYSLYRKLLRHDRDIARIYDLMALRIIVPSIADCYAALGIIHGTWTPLKGRIKDYIAQPKPNGYASLHTTVFCDEGEIVEFQIRTPELHNLAEYGIAAHWQYDESKGQTSMSTEHLPHAEWIKQIRELNSEVANTNQYMNTLEEMKIDIFKDRIFVFTPKGDVIDLPEDSTPVDFAYVIHTEIGNKCSTAKVNDRIEPLGTPLKSGDVVEIMVDKSRKGPNPDWLKFVKTRYARSKIRQQAQVTLKSWISGFMPGGDV
ncbi:RelA/SpoT family protein [Candidatus Uhrbacteria bacterium]|nr:RelA/SpoT family protein [Candidatus Uhrbacteria bacterium]MBD3284365.1 RelA/SpoT family protein [Candidatus Uhrbacteria bacterium]